MAQDNTVILRVELSEGKTQDQLKQLVLDIEKTKKAQADLTAARKAGTVTDEEFAQQTVALRTQLKGQVGEQAALTKNLDSFRSATKNATGSVDQLKAQSALLTAQYNAMSKEQRENTEAGRELADQLDATNKALLEAGQRVGDNRRNVGNYTSSLRDAIKESGLFGGITAKVTEAQETFSKAQNIAKAAIGGNVTALGFLRLALLATGLGALVVVLGSVVAFLTKSQTGIDLVSRKFAGLKAVVDLVTGAAAEFGEKLFNALSNPKQAISDLIDFIETNLLNRVKAIGVIFQALADRDFRKANDGLIQLTVGITNASDKFDKFATAALNAAKAGEAIEAGNQRILRSERALNVERSESRAQIEALKKLSDDSTQSVATRTNAAKEAARIENGLLAEQLKLQDDKIANALRSANLDKQLTNDELDGIAEIRKERADTQQESLTLQTELQNKINSLIQEGLDKSITGRAQALAAEAALLNKQLAQVQVNSDEELRLLQQKLRNGYQAELNVKNLTLQQKLAIDTKYEQDSLTLSLDFARRRMQAALQATLDTTNAELAAQRQGDEEALRLQAQQIENQRRLAVAALAANADNTAALAAINAQAEQQQRQLEYAEASRLLGEYLDRKRQAIELDHAQGLTKEAEYQRQLAALNKAGTDAQTVINTDYRQSNADNQKKAGEDEIAVARLSVAETKQAEAAKQQIKELTLQSAQNYTDTLIALFGEESEAGQAAMALKKVLGLAEIALNLAKQLSANQLASAEIAAIPIIGPGLAAAYLAASDAAAITAAAVGAASILKLQQGGIAQGPSHEQGGIPLFYRGRAAGIEIEGGEPVLTRNVSASPLLLSMASTINQLAGGRALVPRAHMALGGVASPAVANMLRGDIAPAFDYKKLAIALSHLNVKATISDVEAGLARKSYNDSLGND